MHTPETALAECRRVSRDYNSTRADYDARWTLQILYDAGKQWATIAEQAGGNVAVKSLPSIVQRTTGVRYRVTMNKVHEVVVKLKSAISPRQIVAEPRGKHDISSIYTRTSRRVLSETVNRIEGLDKLRQMMLPMHVLGSAGIRMTRRQYGGGTGHGEEQTSLRKYEIDWANIMPWEVIRDPSAVTLYPHRDEEVIGHEKPRTVEWMKQAYGWAPDADKLSATMGSMVSQHDSLSAARGMGTLPGAKSTESKAKGARVREFWLKDTDKTNEIFNKTGIRVDWPWMFVGWADPSEGAEDLSPVPTIGDNGLLPNPFSTMPLFFFHFDELVDGMWAAGVPWRLMQGQDITNIGWTWLVQAMQQSGSKWACEENSVDDPEKAFNNDPWRPIYYKHVNSWSKPPHRIPGAPMPTTPEALVNMAPQWMRDSQGLADVQSGKGYKRDGSGKAYEQLIKQADTVPEDRIVSNELTVARLLAATLVDTIRTSDLKQLRDLLGPEIPDSHIRAIKRDDPRKHLAGVNVHPTTLRPKTVGQTEEHFAGLAERTIIGPGDAVREIYLQAGTTLNTPMARAYEKQASELDRILSGEKDVLPSIGENHGYHIEAMQMFLDSPRSEDVPPKKLKQIHTHFALHVATQAQMGALTGGPAGDAQGAQSPAMPSPPGNGPEGMPGLAPAASAGAAIGAA